MTEKKTNPHVPTPKPKLTKAERRAVQEAQRAAKAERGGAKANRGGSGKASKGGGGSGATAERQQQQGNSSGGGGRSNASAAAAGRSCETAAVDGASKDVQEFSHLPQYRKKYPTDCGLTLSLSTPSSPSALHPSVLSLGLRYANGSVRGANSRCREMLLCFKDVVRDFEPSPGKTFSSDLEHTVKAAFQHWTTRCRTHSVSMGNSFSFVKSLIANLPRDAAEDEAKEDLLEQIDSYLHERLSFAGRVIASHASHKIHDGDVILTYGRSEAVQALLRHAAVELGKKFRVVVVDGRPLLEGRETLRYLTGHGIECTYVLLNGLSYVMREVSTVFLGAAALMSNGSVLSRVGTMGVALAARAANVPVLFGCETYKISARVQLESITGNELGNPDDVASIGTGAGAGAVRSQELDGWRDAPNLKLLNLMYDLTPSEFVSGIVTEMGILPPSSVAVLIREMNPQEESAYH